MTGKTSPLIIITLGIVLAGSSIGLCKSPATLRDLAESALLTHENIARTDSDIRRAEARIRLARSVLMPTLELNGTTTWYGDEATLDLSPTESFVIRPSNDWGWSADVQQTLFNGLRPWRARNVALLQRDQALLEQTTTANNLVLDVAAAFLRASADAQRVEVARSNLKLIESQLMVARRRFEVGETAAADVARWRSERAAAFQRQVVSEGDAALSLRHLERLTGAGPIDKLAPLRHVPVPEGTDDDLVDQALATRLEVATLDHQLQAAGLMIKIEKGGWLPEVTARAQYYKQKAVFPSQDWTSVALTATVPIWDGGRTSARVAEAREDLRQVEFLGREIFRGIANQVDAAAIGHRAAVAADEAADERVEAAREAYRQVERAYRVGESSATDLLTTTTEQIDAETAAIIAGAQREYQAIALRHAVGASPLPDFEPMAILAAQTASEE
ncbi:MAG: TolC family protein [Acidobacteriota bacterium]